MTDPSGPPDPQPPGVEARPAGGEELAMFPLGTVLVPGMPMPLHVFEPRYRALVQDCLEGGREFGVVLISRGSEVGGGDVRTDVGTVARILEAAPMTAGRWALGCVGTRRVRVQRWLPDDPYPRAEVVEWPDDPVTTETADEVRRSLAEVGGQLRQVLALLAELGVRSVPATFELDDDPVRASYQAVAAGPFGPLDACTLLAEEGPAPRLARLSRMLADEREFLSQRLADAAEVLDPDAGDEGPDDPTGGQDDDGGPPAG